MASDKTLENVRDKRFSKEIEKYFIIGVSILFLILTVFVLKGLFSVIVFSLIISYFMYPMYQYFENKINNKKLSSLLTILIMTLLIFVPFALLSYFLILSIIKTILQYNIYIEHPEILNDAFVSFLEKFTNSTVLSSVNFSEIFSTLVIYVSDFAKGFFSFIPLALFYFFITLFLTYYILVYNRKILFYVNEHVPLSIEKQKEILDNIKKNINVLFRGHFLTGVIQTLVALFGYIIFGTPNILILTALTFIVSLIPYLGTPLVWIPVSFYMIMIGETFGGTALFLYGVFVISTIDNFIRPILMSDKDTLSPPIVFVGFLGGFITFGISGIFLGPIIISITVTLLKYLKEYYVKSY